MSDEKPLRIDLKGILRARCGGRLPVPGWLIGIAERMIRQEELNGILRRVHPAEGTAFAKAVLEDLGIKVDVVGLENVPDGARYIFASNHPLGGLDGIALTYVLGSRYGDEGIRFPVNDLLLNVTPLKRVFLPINKYGSQAREGVARLNEAYDSDRQMIYFPAGLVSRLQDGEIRDLEWKPTFVSKALSCGRDIVPVRFEGLNRPSFYRFAKWRKRLGIKFNIEQLLLPSELVKARGAHYRIVFGKPVSHQSMKDSGLTPAEIAGKIREMVYKGA